MSDLYLCLIYASFASFTSFWSDDDGSDDWYRHHPTKASKNDLIYLP